MGSEADCDVRLNKQTSKGRARLEEKELLAVLQPMRGVTSPRHPGVVRVFGSSVGGF